MLTFLKGTQTLDTCSGESQTRGELDSGFCSDTSFETAISEGYQTEDEEEEVRDLEVKW